MAITIKRHDPERPYKWQALCEEHQLGLNSSKPSCLKWADDHIKNHHPGEQVDVQ